MRTQEGHNKATKEQLLGSEVIMKGNEERSKWVTNRLQVGGIAEMHKT